MRYVICFVSMHHGNTKKLVDAIASSGEVATVDITLAPEIDLEKFDVIGLASGVAFNKYYPEMLNFIDQNLPEGKSVFFLHTGGLARENFNAEAKALCEARKCRVLGTYFCRGYDTFGPLRAVGGIAKGHPTEEECEGAVRFFAKIKEDVKKPKEAEMPGETPKP